MKKINWKALLISLAISLGTGGVAALLTSDAMQRFEELNKPPLSPPGWLFPVVWTVLFILMGISAYLVYKSYDPRKRGALAVYGVQLALNFIWTILFFGFSAYYAAFVCLMLLIGSIAWMIAAFYPVNKAAALLQLPYLVWVLFAGYLNLAIALLN